MAAQLRSRAARAGASDRAPARARRSEACGHGRSISEPAPAAGGPDPAREIRAPPRYGRDTRRSEEHTSELQSLRHLVCRLLLEKKKRNRNAPTSTSYPLSVRTTERT